MYAVANKLIKIYAFLPHALFNISCYNVNKHVFGCLNGGAVLYQPGVQVVYGIHGVCRILKLEYQMINRKKTEYYVLEPINHPGTRFYVPTQNQAAVAKLRPVVTQQELDELLRTAGSSESIWTDDENQRKQLYRSLITEGDRSALIAMVSALHKHKASQAAAGRKFHLCDENFLRDAERLLSSEFSLVLGIPEEDIGNYIKSALHIE